MRTGSQLCEGQLPRRREVHANSMWRLVSTLGLRPDMLTGSQLCEGQLPRRREVHANSMWRLVSTRAPTTCSDAHSWTRCTRAWEAGHACEGRLHNAAWSSTGSCRRCAPNTARDRVQQARSNRCCSPCASSVVESRAAPPCTMDLVSPRQRVRAQRLACCCARDEGDSSSRRRHGFLFSKLR